MSSQEVDDKDFDTTILNLKAAGIDFAIETLQKYEPPYLYQASFYQDNTGQRFKWSSIDQLYNYALLYLNEDGTPRGV